MDEKFFVFIGGMVAGVLTMIAIQLVCESTPVQMKKKNDMIILDMKKEAVVHNAAKWSVNTNTNPPVIQFEWIKKYEKL